MEPDIWLLYRQMFRSRCLEQAVKALWEDGKISGEMHLGIGEEAIMAGVVDHLRDGDAMALDHRGTAALLMRGVDPILLIEEFIGSPRGLCAGVGGHMHLFSPPHLAASSGIVGASGPTAAGFALAAQHLRPKAIAVAFFGEGAMNQGMLLEALNLAVVWKLPVLFVCRDNQWAITTPSPSVTGGKLTERAQGFGMPAIEVDGSDVHAVWNAAREAADRGRHGSGPTYLHANCIHFEGHLLGDPLLRRAHRPVQEMSGMVLPLTKAIISRSGAPIRERISNLKAITGLIQTAKQEQSQEVRDPIVQTRHRLEWDKQRLEGMEAEIAQEIQAAVEHALTGDTHFSAGDDRTA